MTTQVAHEMSNRAASKLQNAFIADREGDVAAAMAFYGEALGLLDDTALQWELVIASGLSLESFLPQKLRPEFVQIITTLNINAITTKLQSSGNSPSGYADPFEEVAQILAAGGEDAVVELFRQNTQKVESLRDLTNRIREMLLSLRPLVDQGRLWDEVVPRSFLVTKQKHDLIDLDEKYFAMLMSHAFYLEAISQMSREALIQSSIPYEECQSRRKMQP